jgi:hypothetical protein
LKSLFFCSVHFLLGIPIAITSASVIGLAICGARSVRLAVQRPQLLRHAVWYFGIALFLTSFWLVGGYLLNRFTSGDSSHYSFTGGGFAFSWIVGTKALMQQIQSYLQLGSSISSRP